MKKHEYNGGWVQPIMKGFFITCCDCGLKHSYDFRIKDGKIQIRAKLGKGKVGDYYKK